MFLLRRRIIPGCLFTISINQKSHHAKTPRYLFQYFYGGTTLRIFYGLDRFSEDLDNFMKAIEQEFKAQGMVVSIKTKVKSKQSEVESAFLKSETLWIELILETIAPQLGIRFYSSSVKLQ